MSRLLEEVVERIEARPKLVCCYLISALTPSTASATCHIPPSNAPDHLCCVAGWDVRGAEGPTSILRLPPHLARVTLTLTRTRTQQNLNTNPP